MCIRDRQHSVFVHLRDSGILDVMLLHPKGSGENVFAAKVLEAYLDGSHAIPSGKDR